MFLIEYFDYIFKYQSKRFFKHMIEEILLIILMDNNIMIISTNTKMSIKIYASNNRIIIKESFADSLKSAGTFWDCLGSTWVHLGPFEST